MKLRVTDGLVGGALVIGLAWAWPTGGPPNPDAPVVTPVPRTPRTRTALPTRTAPDVYAQGATQAADHGHGARPSARGLSDAPRLTLRLFEDNGSVPDIARVHSPDCGIAQPATAGVVTLHLPPGTCTFIAQRPSGRLLHQAEPVVLTLEAGDDWAEDLFFPPGETGGLGAHLSRHSDGVQLTHVLSGMGADNAGLMQGDVIVAIEGEHVSAMSLDAIVRSLTGRVGSLVDLEVQDPTDPESGPLLARVRRTYLSLDEHGS